MTCSTRSAKWGLLLPDPTLQGARAVLPTVAQGAPTTPVFAASDGNVGGATPLGVNTPRRNYERLLDTYQIRTARTGQAASSGNTSPATAGFLYKRVEDAANEYRGVDDYRRLWFGDSPDVNLLNGIAVRDQYPLYLRESNRFAIFHLATDGVTFRRYTTPAEGGLRVWSAITFTVPGIDATREAFRLALATMPDGSLRLTVLRGRGTVIQTFDVQTYRSTDEGATWTLLSTAQNFLFASSPVRMTLTESGGWLLLSVSANFFMTSGDGGATWTIEQFVGVAGEINNVAVDIPPNTTTTPPDSAPYDVCALDDRGNFALAYRVEAGDTVYVWRKRGNRPWSYVPTEIFHPPAAFPQPYDIFKTTTLAMTVYKGLVHLVIACSDSADDPIDYLGNQIVLVTLDPGTLRRVDVTPITRFAGMASALWGLRGEVAADKLWLTSGSALRTTLGTPAAKVVVAQLGGWTGRSLGTLESPQGSVTSPTVEYVKTLWRAQWMALCGRPDTPAATGWVRAAAGTPLEGVTFPRYALITADSSSDRVTYTRTIAAPNTGTLLQGGGFEAVATMRIEDVGANAQDGAFFSVDAGSAAAFGTRLWVVCRGARISVYRDVGAGPPSSGEVVGIDFDTSVDFEVRLALRYKEENPVVGKDYSLALSVAPLSDLVAWQTASTTINIIGMPVGEHGGDRLIFGVYDRECTVRFYDVAVAQYDAFVVNRSIGFQNPAGLLGFTQTAEPVYLENGVSVKFGGGSTFLGDSWTSKTHFVYGIENLFSSSPRRRWSSDFTNAEAGTVGAADALAPQTITLDADPDGIGTRFEHTGVYFGGSSERDFTLAYSNSPDPSDPPLETITASAVIASGLSVLTSGIGSLTFAAPAASVDPLPGEWVDHFIRFTSGSANGKAFRVKMNSAARRIHVDDPGGLLVSVSAGALFEVISPSTFLAYAQPARGRYVHITLDDAFTGTKDHRIGALVLGTYLSVNVPLNWTFQDIETERVTPVLTEGGDYWAKEDAPAARAITGEMVGDVARERDAVRYLLRATSRYNLRPAVLVLDDASPKNHVYGVWQGGSAKANVAKMAFSDGEGLYDVGDTTIAFQELK